MIDNKSRMELNRKRALKGFPPIEDVLYKMNPACKMRLLGGENLKSFSRRFVIRHIDLIEDGPQAY